MTGSLARGQPLEDRFCKMVSLSLKLQELKVQFQSFLSISQICPQKHNKAGL